jgi:hypothetical protein
MTARRPNAFGGTFVFFRKRTDGHKKNPKEPPSQHTKTVVNMNGRATTERTPACNITYTQAGVSCFVGQESGKFKVQFFVGSSVVKIPACV